MSTGGYTWIKLYTEIVDDPKMARLPNHLWRLAIELFLLAGKENREGELPSLEDIAWVLHRQEGDVEQDLVALSKVIGLHFDQEQGVWILDNFAERQAALTSTERKRKSRGSNPSSVTKMSQERHENVTEDVTKTSQVRHIFVTEGEKEGEREEEGEKDEDNKKPSSFVIHPSRIEQLYSEHFGTLTAETAKRLADYDSRHPVGWTEKAMLAALKQEKANLNYVGAILNRWRSTGQCDFGGKTRRERPPVRPEDVMATVDNFLRGNTRGQRSM